MQPSTMSPMAVTCACCSMSVDWWVRLRSHPDLPICHDCLAGLNGQRDGQLQLMSGTWLITGFEPIFTVVRCESLSRLVRACGLRGVIPRRHVCLRSPGSGSHDPPCPRCRRRLPGQVLSTSTVKTPTGWRRSGDGRDSMSTVHGTRTMASGRDRSPTPTGTSSDSARPLVTPISHRWCAPDRRARSPSIAEPSGVAD